MDSLTDRQLQILAFENQWWRHAGTKDQAIRDQFEVTAVRYYQELNQLIDSPAATEHDPVLVKRLRRVRAQRQAQRAARSGRAAS